MQFSEGKQLGTTDGPALTAAPPFFFIPLYLLIPAYLITVGFGGFIWSGLQWWAYRKNSGTHQSIFFRTIFYIFFLPSMVVLASLYRPDSRWLACVFVLTLCNILLSLLGLFEGYTQNYFIFSLLSFVCELTILTSCQQVFNQAHASAHAEPRRRSGAEI